MAELRVKTALECRFRPLALPTEPQLCPCASGTAEARLAEGLMTSGAMPEATLQFLLHMDKKLDAILAGMHKETLEQDFPHVGFVTMLSAATCLMECREPFAPRDICELVLVTNKYPLCFLSGIYRVQALLPQPAECHYDFSVYELHVQNMREDDKEALMQLLFQEERSRIRQQKKMD